MKKHKPLNWKKLALRFAKALDRWERTYYDSGSYQPSDTVCRTARRTLEQEKRRKL